VKSCATFHDSTSPGCFPAKAFLNQVLHCTGLVFLKVRRVGENEGVCHDLSNGRGVQELGKRSALHGQIWQSFKTWGGCLLSHRQKERERGDVVTVTRALTIYHTIK
jgi:hypothetical protein